jgi:hypothetical protein
MGFGTLSSSGSTPDVLYNVKMTLYDGTNQCKQVASGVTKNWDSQLCAGKLFNLTSYLSIATLRKIRIGQQLKWIYICIMMMSNRFFFKGELSGGKDTCQGKEKRK